MCKFCHEKFFSTCENSFVTSVKSGEDAVKIEKGSRWRQLECFGLGLLTSNINEKRGKLEFQSKQATKQN